MAGIDLSGLTLNPIEVQEIKDFIIARVFDHPQIKTIHNFQTGIKVKEQIAFASQFGKTGLKKSTANCDIQTSAPESILTEKFWDPIGIEDALILCQATVDKLFKAYYTKISRYRELYDITGSDMEIFYAILIVESMVQAIWRAAWFADTTVAVSSDVTATVTCVDNPLLIVNAVAAGAAGNGITFDIDDVAAGAAAIAVVGTTITASLTAGAKTITDLAALIAATPAAAALITVAGAGATVLIVETPAVVTAGGTDTPGLASAADVKFYDYFDGLFEQIFAAVTATTVNRVTITENAVLTSKPAQLALASGAAVAYLAEVRAASDVRLRSNPNAQYLVTGELFDNYEQWLLDKGVVYDIDILQNGLKSLKYRGHSVVNMETIWDLSSREDFENNPDGLAYYLPHRIVFTDKMNIPIGTLSENDFDELEQWFEKKERKNYTTWGFTEDAKLLEEYMIVVAY